VAQDRGGRPFGPIRTDIPEVRKLAAFLRGLVRDSGRSLESLTGPLGVSTTTIGKYLGGTVPKEGFVTALVAATSDSHADRRRALTLLRAALDPAPVRLPDRPRTARALESDAQLIDAYQRLTRAQDQRDELRDTAENYGRLVVVLWTMVHFLQRRVDGLTRERTALLAARADEPRLERTRRDLAHTQGQERRAVARLGGAQEMRRRAEDMLAQVMDQIGRLTEELEELRADAGLGPEGEQDRDRAPATVRPPVDDAVTADIDRALSRADEISAESARTLERIGRELDEPAPAVAATAAEAPGRAALPLPGVRAEVVLLHAEADTLWAEWVEWLLTAAGRAVLRHPLDGTPEPYGQLPAVLLWSAAARDSRVQGGGQEAAADRAEAPVVLRLDGTPWRAPGVSLPLDGLSEAAAIDAVRAVLGLEEAPPAPQEGRPRFPGAVPDIRKLPTRNGAFTGRTEELALLRARLRGSAPGGVPGARQVHAVVPSVQTAYGLGGVGKTQLVLEYAHRFGSDYDLVWWIDAEQPNLIVYSLAELAGHLGVLPDGAGTGVAEAADLALQALGRGPRRWLLIFDNADEPEPVRPYLPTGSGHVLITSRHQSWNRRARLEVSVFTEAEAVQHLLRRVPGLARADAAEVAGAVAHLPLAVEIAASWLAETDMPVASYVEALNEQATRGLGATTPEDYPAPLNTTWQISLARLREMSPSSVRLLQVCSFMAPEPISLRLVYSDQMFAALLPYDEELRDRLMMGRVLHGVRRFALAKVDVGDGSLQVHRLVQAVVRDGMTLQEADETRHTVHRLLVGLRPDVGDTDDPANWPDFDRIWPHLAPSAADTCDEPDTRQLLIDRVRYLWQRGDLPRAERLARELAEGWGDRLGEDDRQVLQVRLQLAGVLRSQGRFTECLALDEDVLERQRRTRQEDHPQTLRTAGSVAADLRSLGRFQEALELDTETGAKMREQLGDDSPETLALAHNRALDLHVTGDYAASRELNEEVSGSFSVVLGPRHPQTLASRAALAGDLRALGDYSGSVALLRELQEESGESRPDPAALGRATSLALSLRRAGFAAEARELARSTHDAYRDHHGDTGPGALACTLALASAYAAEGEPGAALDLTSAMLGRLSEVLGSRHPSTLICAHNHAIHLRHDSRLREALIAARSTWQALRSVLGEQHPYALIAGVTLANTLGETGEAAKAVRFTTRCLDRLAERLSGEHPDVLATRANLAVAVRELGRTDEADALRDAAVAGLARILPREHPWLYAAGAGRRIDRDLEMFPL
jgi:tetratricopeptide (TPR) repeat protein